MGRLDLCTTDKKAANHAESALLHFSRLIRSEIHLQCTYTKYLTAVCENSNVWIEILPNTNNRAILYTLTTTESKSLTQQLQNVYPIWTTNRLYFRLIEFAFKEQSNDISFFESPDVIIVHCPIAAQNDSLVISILKFHKQLHFKPIALYTITLRNSEFSVLTDPQSNARRLIEQKHLIELAPEVLDVEHQISSKLKATIIPDSALNQKGIHAYLCPILNGNMSYLNQLKQFIGPHVSMPQNIQDIVAPQLISPGNLCNENSWQQVVLVPSRLAESISALENVILEALNICNNLRYKIVAIPSISRLTEFIEVDLAELYSNILFR